jgi:hypothetical protein
VSSIAASDMHLLRLILDPEFQTIVLHPLRGPAASTRESTLFRNAVIDHNNSANEDPALRQPAASTREDTLVYATPPFQEGPRPVAQLLYMALDDELFKDVLEPQSPFQQSRHVPDAPFMSTELRRPSSLPQRQNKGSPPPGAICCRLARLAATGGLPALSWSGVIWRAYVALAFPALHWGSPLEDLKSAQLRRCTLPDRLGVTLVIDRDLASEDESHHHLLGCSDMHIFCSH